MHFGLLLLSGAGRRSAKNQRKALIDAGVPENKIGDVPMRALRSGDRLSVCWLDYRSCAELARFYQQVSSRGAELHIVEIDKTYAGMDQLPGLIEDWERERRRRQTDAARKAAKASNKGRRSFPKPGSERDQFMRLWNDGMSKADMAAAMGVSWHTINRAQKLLKLEKRKKAG